MNIRYDKKTIMIVKINQSIYWSITALYHFSMK